MTPTEIHPTAIVDGKAEIGTGTVIGPYCVIGPDVVLGHKCWLQHHITLAGPTRAGARNKFYAYCSIGQQTQDLKYQGEPTYLEIGDDNTFREFVTVNRSTTSEGKTRVGNGGNFLAYSHIGHDCVVKRRRFFQQRHAGRARSSGRRRGNWGTHGRPSVLPNRNVRSHRWLLENRAGCSAFYDCRRQSGGNSRC